MSEPLCRQLPWLPHRVMCVDSPFAFFTGSATYPPVSWPPHRIMCRRVSRLSLMIGYQPAYRQVPWLQIVNRKAKRLGLKLSLACQPGYRSLPLLLLACQPACWPVPRPLDRPVCQEGSKPALLLAYQAASRLVHSAPHRPVCRKVCGLLLVLPRQPRCKTFFVYQFFWPARYPICHQVSESSKHVN